LKSISPVNTTQFKLHLYWSISSC